MSSNIFIGTDIESVSRIAKIINSSKSENFKKRIFTKKEIEYCETKSNPAIHFAGRFSAKEAVTKALLASEKIDSIKMSLIEITSTKTNKPEVNLLFDSNLKMSCKVSISHTKEFAIAFALLEIVA